MNTAFKVRSNIWAMRHNKPTQGIVYGVLLTPENGAIGPVVATYLIWFSDSLCSVTEDQCQRFEGKDIFSTKEDLLGSL